MQNNKLIEISPNPPTDPINLQSISVFLGITISLSVLATLFFKVVTKFNEIDLGFRDLREDVKNHTGEEGYEKIILQIKILEKEIYSLDKRFDLHSQNYINRQEVVQMLLTQLEESIKNKAERWEGELKEVEKEVRELQRYLQKQTNENFTIRENER